MKPYLISILLILFTYTSLVCADEIDDLIPAIIEVESGGNPNAVSPKGAIGILQITPIVLEEWNSMPSSTIVSSLEELKYYDYGWRYKKEELFNPEINKNLGIWYLRRLKNHYLKDIEIQEDYFWTNNVWIGYPPNKFILYEYTKDIQSAEDYKIALILAAYNGGPTKLRKVGYDINKMPAETRAYIKKVLKVYKELQAKKVDTL